MNTEIYEDVQYCCECESETNHVVTKDYDYDTIEFECTVCNDTYVRQL